MTPKQPVGSWDPSYEWKAVVLLAIGFGLVGLDRTIIAPLFPVMVEDLGLTYQDLGTVSGILAIFWGIFSIITGGLSDKIGRRRVLIPAIIGFSLVSGITGLATGLGSLLVIRAVMGAFEGAFTPTSIAHTSEVSKPQRRGFNMGFQQSLFALLGLGFGPIIATQLLGVVPSWRWVFVIVALPGLLVAYLLHRTLREPAHTDRAALNAAPGAVERRPWGEIFRYRNVTLGTLALFGVFSCGFLIIALMPNYLTDHIGLSIPQMGFVTSAYGFGGFVGYLAVPGLSDRLGRKPVLVGAFAVGAVCLFGFSFVGANPLMLFLPLFVIAVCVMGAVCLLAGPVATEAVPASLVASAAGVPIGIGEIAGGGLGPIIGGFVAQSYGIDKILYVAIFGLAFGLVVSFLLKETAPAKVGKTPENASSEPVPSSL
jgi:MFS family permease